MIAVSLLAASLALLSGCGSEFSYDKLESSPLAQWAPADGVQIEKTKYDGEGVPEGRDIMTIWDFKTATARDAAFEDGKTRIGASGWVFIPWLVSDSATRYGAAKCIDDVNVVISLEKVDTLRLASHMSFWDGIQDTPPCERT